MLSPRALVGTTGWSHPDWVGPVYPVHLRERPDAWLAHYAARFRTVEIAASFDQFPDEALVTSWAREGAILLQRAPFEFSLKLPRAITHEALPAGDVESAREWAGDFDREVLDPLDGEGLLGVVLAQLPPSFEFTPENASILIDALSPLAERRVALELRSPTWVRGGCVVPELDRLFASRDLCLVEADLPGAPDVRAPIAARHAYLRLHGRRAEAWRADDEARDGAAGAHASADAWGARYDYCYQQAELEPVADRVREHLRAGREVRCYFNNPRRAQAVANAADLLGMIGAGSVNRPKLTAQQRLPF